MTLSALQDLKADLHLYDVTYFHFYDMNLIRSKDTLRP
jgi:hypothetical protein